MLDVEVVGVKGRCPVYKVEDEIIIEGPRILLENTDDLFINAPSVILYYAVALDKIVDLIKPRLTKLGDKENAYILFVDPKEPYTKAGKSNN